MVTNKCYSWISQSGFQKPVWGLQFLSHVTLGHGDSCVFFCALTVQSKGQGSITLRELLYPKLGHNSRVTEQRAFEEKNVIIHHWIILLTFKQSRPNIYSKHMNKIWHASSLLPLWYGRAVKHISKVLVHLLRFHVTISAKLGWLTNRVFDVLYTPVHTPTLRQSRFYPMQWNLKTLKKILSSINRNRNTLLQDNLREIISEGLECHTSIKRVIFSCILFIGRQCRGSLYTQLISPLSIHLYCCQRQL